MIYPKFSEVDITRMLGQNNKCHGFILVKHQLGPEYYWVYSCLQFDHLKQSQLGLGVSMSVLEN